MFFRDIGSDVLDFLSKPYVFDSGVTARVATESPLKWRTDATIVEGEKDASESKVACSLGASYEDASGVSLEKLEIHTDGRVRMDASLRSSEALRFLLKVEDSRHELGKPLQSHGKVGAAYATEALGTDLEVDVVNGPTLVASLCMAARSGAFLGFGATLNTMMAMQGSPTFSDIGVGLGFRGGDWSGTLRTVDNAEKLRITLQKAKGPWKVAANVDWALGDQQQTLTAGVAKALDAGTVLHAKICSRGALSAALENRISPRALLRVAGELDVTKLAADTHRWGCSLELDL